MFDAAGERSENVHYTLEQSNSKYLLGFVPDPNWINAVERVFPITIDPTVVVNNSSNIVSRTMGSLYDDITYNSEIRRIGFKGPRGEFRTAMMFNNLEQYKDYDILNATLCLIQIASATNSSAANKKFEVREANE